MAGAGRDAPAVADGKPASSLPFLRIFCGFQLPDLIQRPANKALNERGSSLLTPSMMSFASST